jgi:hypothetical protein
MEADIKKLIIDTAGTVYLDFVLVNPQKLASAVTSHVMEFLKWEKENAIRFEYYTREQVYNIYKER